MKRDSRRSTPGQPAATTAAASAARDPTPTLAKALDRCDSTVLSAQEQPGREEYYGQRAHQDLAYRLGAAAPVAG